MIGPYTVKRAPRSWWSGVRGGGFVIVTSTPLGDALVRSLPKCKDRNEARRALRRYIRRNLSR